ncbi:hypothetical protein C0993_012798 [Termitomyces sp. T159_Od127]|nr:hypothetical protein C0993_012798 [Termitomyces sp. T159_Od127]
MSTVIDCPVFRDIFSSSASSAIWSDKTRTSYYLRYESALATVQARFGIIPASAIAQKCNVDLFDMEELEKEKHKIGHPVLPVAKQLVQLVNEAEPGLGDRAHWGATTQDVTDLIYDLCRKAAQEDRPLVDLLSEDEIVLDSGITRNVLELWCDPANYMGLSQR